MAIGDFLDCWQPSNRHRLVRDLVAEAFGLEPFVLIGRGRRQSVVWPRHVAMWVVRECFPSLSFVMIARLFGGRDHSSIIYAVDKVEYRRERDGAFVDLTDALVRGLGRTIPVLVLGDEERTTVEIVCGRMKPRSLVRPAERRESPPRSVLPKNDFSEDDCDARKRMLGSDALAEAIEREGLVCR